MRMKGMTEVSLGLPHKFVPHWKLLAAGLTIKITQATCYCCIEVGGMQKD